MLDSTTRSWRLQSRLGSFLLALILGAGSLWAATEARILQTELRLGDEAVFDEAGRLVLRIEVNLPTEAEGEYFFDVEREVEDPYTLGSGDFVATGEAGRYRGSLIWSPDAGDCVEGYAVRVSVVRFDPEDDDVHVVARETATIDVPSSYCEGVMGDFEYDEEYDEEYDYEE